MRELSWVIWGGVEVEENKNKVKCMLKTICEGWWLFGLKCIMKASRDESVVTTENKRGWGRAE